MAATSRRIAWPTVTIDSRATVSGSASRMATSAIDWVMSRNSCDAPRHVGEHVEEDDRREEDQAPARRATARSDRSGRARPASRAGTSSRASARRTPRPPRTRSRRCRTCAPDGVAGSAGSGRSTRDRRWPGGATCPGPRDGRTSSSSNTTSWAGAVRVVRHGGSDTGSSSGCVIGGGGGDAGAGSGAGSRTLSASWIADSAASVGSFIFLGVFAMSVVASHYAGPEPRRVEFPTANERV